MLQTPEVSSARIQSKFSDVELEIVYFFLGFLHEAQVKKIAVLILSLLKLQVTGYLICSMVQMNSETYFRVRVNITLSKNVFHYLLKLSGQYLSHSV